MRHPQKAGKPASKKLLNRGEMYWPAVTKEWGRCEKLGDETYPTRSKAKAAAAAILKSKGGDA